MNTLDLTFNALADPTRRAILTRLARGEATVGELARPFEISLPAISRHLKVLEEAALISNERDLLNAQASLNRTLGRIVGAPIIPTDTLALPPTLPDSSTLEQIALENRQELKALQQQWKTSGHLPRKQGDELWKRFRAACDKFFERRKPVLDARTAEEAENQSVAAETVGEQSQALAGGQLERERRVLETVADTQRDARLVSAHWLDLPIGVSQERGHVSGVH